MYSSLQVRAAFLELHIVRNVYCSILEEIIQACLAISYSELSRNGHPSHRRSVLNPDLIYLVDSTGVQKAFVLDNGKLQLEMVKQAFGLTSVELIISK